MRMRTERAAHARRSLQRVWAWLLGEMSAVQVMAQSGLGGGAADRTPFFGIKVPLELRKTVQLAKAMDISLFKKIVKCELI